MIKTVTLKTAQMLKENCFRQDTLFSWSRTHVENPYILGVGVLQPWETVDKEHCIASPTTDELLEELPSVIKNKHNATVYLRIDVMQITEKFRIQYQRKFDEGKFTSNRIPVNAICNNSLPEALAHLWLYLKKEGLL